MVNVSCVAVSVAAFRQRSGVYFGGIDGEDFMVPRIIDRNSEHHLSCVSA